MPWFKVDDTFWGNPKVLACSPSAVGLWTVAGSWAAQQLTDGFIPETLLGLLRSKRKQAMELVDAGLWDKVDGGFRFHDWADYQPSKEKVSADREAARERMRKIRSGSVQGSSKDVRANTDRTSEEVRDPRPDPSLPKEKRRAPAKPDAGKPQPIEHEVTTAAYNRVGKALNFLAVRGIVKWAIHDREQDPKTVEECIVALYGMGKPITKQIVGQYIDGIIGDSRITTRPDAPRDHKSGLLVER